MYLTINNIDFSKYTSSLNVSYSNNYSAMTSAEGNTVVDYINKKRVINCKVIALDAATAQQLISIASGFSVKVNFLNPSNNKMETSNFIIPKVEVEYYTIQDNKTIVKEFDIEMQEL